MKKLSTRIFTLFLALLVLFTSSGFGLVEHSCSLRGKKTYSFISKETCKFCGSHKPIVSGKASFSKSKCCDEKQIEKKENLTNSISNSASKVIKEAVGLFTKAAVFIISKVTSTILELFTRPNPESNSFFGKSLLQFISVFRL
jgi:hypothetical protein